MADLATYLRLAAELKVLQERALDEWEGLSHHEKIQAMEAERDRFLKLANDEEAAGRDFMGRLHRDDAQRVQERIDRARAQPCPTCGQKVVVPACSTAKEKMP